MNIEEIDKRLNELKELKELSIKETSNKLDDLVDNLNLDHLIFSIDRITFYIIRIYVGNSAVCDLSISPDSGLPLINHREVEEDLKLEMLSVMRNEIVRLIKKKNEHSDLLKKIEKAIK